MAITVSSNDLIELDRLHLWHPFTQMKTARPPIPIKNGKGVYLYDMSGRPYIDGISSWWVNLHGHAHPYIIDKIKAQLDQLEHVLFADFTHAPAVEFASRLLPLLPGTMSKLFYSDNGSTAVEAGIKIALQYWYNQDSSTSRKKVICLKNSYHGDTFGAMSAAGKNAFNRPFWNHLFTIESIDPPMPGLEEQTISQLDAILKQGDVACFIFEPLILGTGGMVIYSASGLDQCIQRCREKGVLIIADEVMTGFGRTGTLFACDQLYEKPDLICLSKGITGGFLPLGATVCTQEIYDAFLGDTLHQAFLHGHSYTANPLACSAALGSLELLLNERCTEQRKRISTCHKAFCEEWHAHPKLKRCESLGTILALEYQVDNTSYFQSLRDRLYDFFLDQGILLRPLGNVLYVLPPYCINDEELNYIYNQIVTTLKEEI